MSAAPRSGIANEELNDGAAWTAGNATFPMLASPVNPKQPRAWFSVTDFWMRRTFRYMCGM